MQGAKGPEHCIYLPFSQKTKEIVLWFKSYWYNYSDVAYVPLQSEGQAKGLLIVKEGEEVAYINIFVRICQLHQPYHTPRPRRIHYRRG